MCGSLAGILFLRHFRTIPVLGRMIFSMMVCIRWFFYWFCISLVSLARTLVQFWRHLVFGPQNAFAKFINYNSEIKFYHLPFQQIIMWTNLTSREVYQNFTNVCVSRSGQKIWSRNFEWETSSKHFRHPSLRCSTTKYFKTKYAYKTIGWKI